MEFIERNNVIEFDVREFEAKHIFECGQAFRWYKKENGSYDLIAHQRLINVKSNGGKVIITASSKEDFEDIWFNYFDLANDYGQIKKSLPENDFLKKAMDFGYGIRILNQEKFETIISFIISANNMIPRIKSSIEKLSQMYGSRIGESSYYSFPKIEELAKANPMDLREYARVGFRDERIVETSKILLTDEYNLDFLSSLNTDNLREKLLTLPGVGPKVCGCILLFAFARSDNFPVDVWIKRVMETEFIKDTKKPKEVEKYSKDLFGDLAGYAQQYLFYYGRENSIGKELKNKEIKQK